MERVKKRAELVGMGRQIQVLAEINLKLYSHTYIGGGGGHAVVQLGEALRYKPESRGFHSRWSHWNFSVI
jgi:hypothetical protein